MIESYCKIVKAVFFAVCSECGAEGPEELSTQDAHKAAIACGWSYQNIYPEGRKVAVYTCSACQVKTPAFDNPPIFATRLDPDCEISDADPGL